MVDRIFVSAIGAIIEIDATSLEDSSNALIRHAWRDALITASGPREPAAVVVVRAMADADAMLAALSTDVTLAALEQRRGELWMLHAAGLADEHGHVVVLCAPSGTGKTTAARHLSARYAYVSDETVGIDSRGTITPYRKPLSIIEAGRASKKQVAPSEFEGGSSSSGELRLSKIVVLNRSDDGPDQPVIEPLELIEAMTLLTPQTSYLSDLPGALRMIASVLAATAGAMRVRYREARSLDGIIDELMSRTPPTMAAAPAMISTPNSSRSNPGEEMDWDYPRYFRSAVVDTLDLPGGRLAILQAEDAGGRLKILDGIAPTLWGAANGASLESLCTHVVRAHGVPAHAEANELVSDAVRTLVLDGVLSENSVR